MHTMNGKTVLVTGANSGIGLATAKGLAKAGARVVMVCRSKEKGQAARQEVIETSGNQDIHLIRADLSVQSEIHAAATEFTQRFNRLDVLINNAAIIPPSRELTKDGIETQFAVNHLSYFLLTHLLLNVLKASAPSRIVNVSSNLHSAGRFEANNVEAEKGYGIGGVAQYNNTKLFNMLFTFELARRLEGTGVTVNALHPGVIATNLTRALPRPLNALYRMVMPKPESGARTSIHLASSPDVEGITGKYWANSAISEPAPHSQRKEDARALWEISERMTSVMLNKNTAPSVVAAAI
jgi:NAD(P)-dependent dehydrogenase (short-subunit alcohol dehydrogenase family)